MRGRHALHRWRRRAPRDAGQATVEFALCLPLVVVLVLGLLQVAVVARHQLAIELAAREGARAAAVSAAPDAAARGAVARVIGDRDAATVSVHTDATTVTVTVRLVDPTDLPLIGRVVGDAPLRADATMALEPP